MNTLPLYNLYNESLTKGITPAIWTRAIKRSALEDALSISHRPGLITFALGLPAPEIFPTDAYSEAARELLSQDPLALQYGPPSRQLKSQIVKMMADSGFRRYHATVHKIEVRIERARFEQGADLHRSRSIMNRF